MIKIGVLSDTHGHLDKQILAHFDGVDHIIHAGDIGLPWLLLELESIAPVTAVLGNNDSGLDFKETAIVELGGRKLLVHHIIDPHEPDERIKRRIIRENPDIVIFGHTHKKFCQIISQTLYFNPGYAGKDRTGEERTVAVLSCDETGITADYLEL